MRCALPRTPLLLAALLATPALAKPPAAAAVPRREVPDVDGCVARTMRTFDVPGMAVALVKDGRVVLEKGYGVRRSGEAGDVSAATLFGIASNTKAFTCAA